MSIKRVPVQVIVAAILILVAGTLVALLRPPASTVAAFADGVDAQVQDHDKRSDADTEPTPATSQVFESGEARQYADEIREAANVEQDGGIRGWQVVDAVEERFGDESPRVYHFKFRAESGERVNVVRTALESEARDGITVAEPEAEVSRHGDVELVALWHGEAGGQVMAIDAAGTLTNVMVSAESRMSREPTEALAMRMSRVQRP